MCELGDRRFAVIATWLLVLICGCSTEMGRTTGAATVSVTLSGPQTVRLGATTQYEAQVPGAAGQSLTWQVDGVAGGSAATGTISSSGVYNAPTLMPASGVVTLSAVSQAEPDASATVALTLENPLPVITSASATQVGTSSSYKLDILGTGFVPASIVMAGADAVVSSFVSSGEVTANVTLAAGTPSIEVSVTNPDPGGASSDLQTVPITSVLATASAAGRILDQTSFGPTAASIQHVQQIGISAYLQEQFSIPPTQLASLPAAGIFCGEIGITAYQCASSEWWQATLTAPDQLRRRVAFALSEMFVVSLSTIGAQGVPDYDNVLARDAFGNFADLLKDVTLSVAMGRYLDMFNSARAAQGRVANENYARELIQLFSLGPNLLNQDGSRQLDGYGYPIPTCTQDQVEAFARAFTGWTSSTGSITAPAIFDPSPNYTLPMVAVEGLHDAGSKMLLNGVTLAAGQSAEQDLTDALNNIFQHPNVGAFVAKQLIQDLVSSTPSPGYIARVAAVFNDNGKGVRGDMRAVLTAIFEDAEARAGDTDPSFDGGRLREPILYLANSLRALGSTNNDPGGLSYWLSGFAGYSDETPYFAPSVFNFFPSDYLIPQTSINAPEFGLEDNANYLERLTIADTIVSNHIDQYDTDLSETSTLGAIAQDPTQLVEYLSLLLMHDHMPRSMKTVIVNEITPLTSRAQRARVAVYLVITSPQYLVIH